MMTRGQIAQLDREFSLLIRSKGKCERCNSTQHLQTSHIYSRRYMSIRWSVMNAMCLCAGCHWWWTLNPTEAGAWALRVLGEDHLNALRIAKMAYGKWLTPTVIRESWKADAKKTT